MNIAHTVVTVESNSIEARRKDIFNVYSEEVLQSVLEEDEVACPALMIVESPSGSHTKFTILMVEDVFAPSDGGRQVGTDPETMEAVLEMVNGTGGKLTFIAIATEGVVGTVGGGSPDKAVFLAYQDISGNTAANIYKRNEENDPTGYFSEPKNISTVAVKAANTIVGLIWKEYLVAKAINNN